MKALIIHGPNLNMLGKRDSNKYGKLTLSEINHQLEILGKSLGCELSIFQSNHEGAIIDFLQQDSSRAAEGAVINPGALVRYGYSLRAACIDFSKPIIEVHMSDIHKTGISKAINVLDDVRIDQIVGLQEKSYYEGLKKLVTYVRK